MPARTELVPAAAWIERWRPDLERFSDLLLGLAVVLLWTDRKMQVSAVVATLWLLLRLAIAPGGGIRNGMLMLLVLLNLRGVALQEGPQPIGPIDYLIIITAFVAGLGRSLRQWRFTLICLSAGNLVGLLLKLPPLQEALRAIFSGSADRPGWHGQSWGGQYFRGEDISVNQSALLCGLGLTVALAMAWRCRGSLRALMTATALLCGTAAFATGSRLAMLLPPALAATALAVTRVGDGSRHGSVRPRPPGVRGRLRLLLLAAAGLAVLALLLHLGVGERLLQLYATRKTSGDDMRLQVVLCYARLPFQMPWFWLIGAGYDEPRRRFCDEDVGITVTHSHNFLAQVMGESGLVAAAAVLITAVLLTLRLWRLRPVLLPEGAERRLALTTAPALMAGTTYLFLFQMFELGMMKVTLLTMLFGFLPACVLGQTGGDPGGGEAPGGARPVAAAIATPLSSPPPP